MLVESGVLLPKEGRELLEEIDSAIIQVRACPYSEHPGTVATEGDDDNLSVEEVSLRRRKRTKQKSLL